MGSRRILLAWLSLAACTTDLAASTPPTLHATRAAPERVARDFDKDGLVDTIDRCPDAAGRGQDGCPDPDSDGDGVLDSKDACRMEAGVQDDGCPIRDGDGDGLLDPDDRCQAQAEIKNGFEDGDGCPDELPVDLAAMTGIIKGIAFDLGKDTIRPGSRTVLDRAVAVLQKYAEVRIEISGHRDSTGSVEYRTDLTARRAAAIKRYLVEHGIAVARLESRGAGPDEPIDTNKTAAGRAKNRRIEFTILVQ
jgi:outer membrane protein OmpA-like peptidoglycan-associated protein